MCPLRFILVFLSATIAGFFVLRRIKTQSEEAAASQAQETEDSEEQQLPMSTKVGSAICLVFWTFVDMASGRYLWRNLVADKKAL